MPKLSKEDLSRNFVRFLGKKYVFDVLDILMGRYPSPENMKKYIEFKYELIERGFKRIGDRALTDTLKGLMYYKIIVKRKPVENLREKVYCFTPLGFFLANKIVVDIPNDILGSYNADLSELRIRNTIKA